MKRIISPLLKVMKVASFFAVFSMLCFIIMAMKAKKTADNVWEQLGIGIPQANMDIKNSFLHGYLDYTGAKNAKNIALGNRVAVVNQLVEYAKKHYKSDEFRSAYAKYRDAVKPKAPQFVPETLEEIKAMEKTRLEQALKMAEQNLNSTNPKIKNGAPARIESIKKELKELNDPNNPTIKRRMEQNERSSLAFMKAHEMEVEKFNTKLPADPNLLLKRRLEEILAVTSEVDYEAELKDGYGGKKVFVNPLYEKKPKDWKLAYRAGKVATDAVRAAAEKWLMEL
jgi:hypothetical protein